MNASVVSAILRKPLVNSPRTRRYQEALDRAVDELKRATVRETTPFYATFTGRESTSRLCQTAFCWHSTLSRHHGDGELLRCFESGLRYHLDSIRDDGLMGTFGLNGETWAHGWDIEGLIYGLILCGDALDPKLVALARERFALSATRHAKLVETGGSIGTYGNQRLVYALGLYLYGQFLEKPDWVRTADELAYDALPKVLDESGQVIEQHGPCMHYSYTAFSYAWLNLVVRGDTSHHERLLRCLDWFRRRHTRSLYPMAGPSARQHYETMPRITLDLWPAAEQFAHVDPTLREFVDSAATRIEGAAGKDDVARCAQASAHGASVLMWAMLMAQEELQPDRLRPAFFTRYYERTKLAGRSPLKYALVHRRYQTHFNVRDFLPFSGIQTWALDDEPPIIHPTRQFPSTTQAWGLDTARQGVSHNWGLYGAGLMAADACFSEAKSDGDITFLVARYDWLWKLVFFTELSTVQLEFGNGGARRTLWTLNRIEPAEPELADGVTRFKGRRACLHSTVVTRPALVESGGVRQLAYECEDGVAAFALSDGSFRFEGGQPLVDRALRFSDAAGRYEVTLHEGFLRTDNPGNFSIDVWQLAHHGTTARLV